MPLHVLPRLHVSGVAELYCCGVAWALTAVPEEDDEEPAVAGLINASMAFVLKRGTGAVYKHTCMNNYMLTTGFIHTSQEDHVTTNRTAILSVRYQAQHRIELGLCDPARGILEETKDLRKMRQ